MDLICPFCVQQKIELGMQSINALFLKTSTVKEVLQQQQNVDSCVFLFFCPVVIPKNLFLFVLFFSWRKFKTKKREVRKSPHSL